MQHTLRRAGLRDCHYLKGSATLFSVSTRMVLRPHCAAGGIPATSDDVSHQLQ